MGFTVTTPSRLWSALRPVAIAATWLALPLALLPAFSPGAAGTCPEDVDEICQNYLGTALWIQCNRAVASGCNESDTAHPRCEQWAQIWRDTTNIEPAWLPKTVFVSSMRFTSNLVAEATVLIPGSDPLDGLEAGDLICQYLADHSVDAPVHAPEGTYFAWLSTDAGSPNTGFTKSAVPYLRIDGEPVAANYDDLTDGSLLAPIVLDETGVEVVPGGQNLSVWTGTSQSGDWTGRDCGGWAVDPTSGGRVSPGVVSAHHLTGVWSDVVIGPTARCDALDAFIYCFQQ